LFKTFDYSISKCNSFKYDEIIFNIKSFSDFIVRINEKLNEAFVLKDKTIIWDSKSKSSDSIIKTMFGKSKLVPYVKNFNVDNDIKIKVLSLFGRNTNTTPVLIKAIKGQSKKIKMDTEAEDKMVNRMAIYLSRLLREEGEIDCIVSIHSSSKLLKKVLDKTMEKFGANIPVYFDAIYKNPIIDEVYVDNLKISSGKDRYLKGIIHKWEANNYIEIKDIENAGYRKYIHNWLVMKKDVAKKIEGKKIIIVDDILTSGSTVIEAARQCYDNGAVNVVAYTLLDN
jgi:hypothetical protein